MGKYVLTESEIFTLFDSAEWKAEAIPTFPANFDQESGGKEWIRMSIVPNGDSLNMLSISGVLMIELFIATGRGPRPISVIADTLDSYLQQRTFGTTQFFKSALGPVERDRDNPILARAIYSIPFSHFGVN